MQEPDHPGLPLHQGADRRALVLADDEVSLPMAGLGAILGTEGPLMNREHGLLEPGRAPFGPLMRAPVIASGAQRGATVRCQR
jgi:hypothetical protein